MAWMALGIALVLAGAFAALARRRSGEEPAPDWVVEPLRLLAPAEQELYAQLRLAFPNHLVLTQVSLAKLLRMRRSRGSMAVFRPYHRMAVPFVVCTKESMPLVVVEVHATRDVPKPSREQARRAAIVKAAGLVHLTIAATPGAVPAAEDLRQRVRAALQAKPLRGAPAAGPAAARAAAPARAPVTDGTLDAALRTSPGMAAQPRAAKAA